MKTDEIRPALTPEEWAKFFETCDESPGDRSAFAAVAIANAWVPDDDPRKITRADVADLSEFASLTDNMLDSVEILLPLAQVRRLAILHAKLAALLPPE